MTPEFGSPRTAIVTGGARRIGAAFVRALAADGWTLLIHCNESIAEGRALAAELPDARVVQADLSAPDCAEAILAGLDGMPVPGLLVNSASRFDLDQFDDFTTESWDRHFLPNLRGPALLTRGFASRVPEREGALIVNVLDAKLAQPNPDFFTYTLSKYGLAALTELTARALAARHIRVCAIAPAVTLVSGKQTRDNFDQVHNLNALDRGVIVDDLVATLRFLIASPGITGEVIRVDAGQRFLGLSRDVQFLDESA